MTLTEALQACEPSLAGDRIAVTYPNRDYMAVQPKGGGVTVVRVTEEDSKGGSCIGGSWGPPDNCDGYLWRPAVKIAAPAKRRSHRKKAAA